MFKIKSYMVSGYQNAALSFSLAFSILLRLSFRNLWPFYLFLAKKLHPNRVTVILTFAKILFIYRYTIIPLIAVRTKLEYM